MMSSRARRCNWFGGGGVDDVDVAMNRALELHPARRDSSPAAGGVGARPLGDKFAVAMRAQGTPASVNISALWRRGWKGR